MKVVRGREDRRQCEAGVLGLFSLQELGLLEEQHVLSLKLQRGTCEVNATFRPRQGPLKGGPGRKLGKTFRWDCPCENGPRSQLHTSASKKLLD